MRSKKRLILPLHQNGLVLPQAFIPKNTEAFVCDLQEDGRLMLSPVAASAEGPSKNSASSTPLAPAADFPNVIDFQEGRVRLKKQTRQKKKAAEVSKSEEARRAGTRTDFVKLHLFSSRMEAEMVGEILKQAEIPYLIQSEDIGIFGPGASPAPGGARIGVRRADLEDARIMLSGLI